MMARARHEAMWTHQESTVKGSAQRNKPWVLILLVALIAGLAALGYTRFWNLQTVTYELRQCAQPLTAESSWADVQAAACEPVEQVDLRGTQLVVTNEGEQIQPATVEGSTFSFENIPIHSPAPGLRVDLDRPVSTIVIAEPDNEQIRREMNRLDSAGTSWSAHIGSRGPLHYWVLLTP